MSAEQIKSEIKTLLLELEELSQVILAAEFRIAEIEAIVEMLREMYKESK